MPSPFPGMDPYLERSRWFRGLHNSLVFCLQEALQPLLPAPYFALSGELIWMERSERYVDPDVDVLRRVPSGPREAVESGEEGGVATLVAEAEDGADRRDRPTVARGGANRAVPRDLRPARR